MSRSSRPHRPRWIRTLDGSGGLRTEGRRLLCILRAAIGGGRLAASLEITKQSLSDLCAGRSRPTFERMLTLRDKHGIPLDTWGELPGARNVEEDEEDEP
jgi:hypothetical protein